HPVTGRKFLYVNEGFTQHIVGLTARQSRRLLNYLLDHINRPEYQVRFHWRNGSVAMWDNRITQHYAVADYLPAYRCMHRITVMNDRRAETIAGAPKLAG
ncbi:MAG: TauD/TfdA family dioxygenase, partial [Pseudomonadota bacterium]